MIVFVADFIKEVPPMEFFTFHLGEGLHLEGLGLCRANRHAVVATGAVFNGHLYAEVERLEAFAFGGDAFHVLRRGGCFICIKQEGADTGMWANVGALIALDAGLGIPAGNLCCGGAFFPSGGSEWKGAILASKEGADWKGIAALCIDGVANFPNEFGSIESCGGFWG